MGRWRHIYQTYIQTTDKEHFPYQPGFLCRCWTRTDAEMHTLQLNCLAQCRPAATAMDRQGPTGHTLKGSVLAFISPFSSYLDIFLNEVRLYE